MKDKIKAKYAVEAILLQLRKYRADGEGHIVFNEAASHPEADEGCTFGDLIDALPDAADTAAATENLFDKLARLAAELDQIGDDFQAAYSSASRVAGLKLLSLTELARGMSRETDELLAALKSDTQDPRTAKLQGVIERAKKLPQCPKCNRKSTVRRIRGNEFHCVQCDHDWTPI
jgi:hypothetical protein